MEQPSADTVAVLRRSGLCEGLSDDEVQRVAREGVLVSYNRGELLFGENSDANRLFLILRGVVRIETRPPRSDGAGMVLDHLHAGRVLGEVGLIDEQPRSAAAVAEEESTLFTLTRADIERLGEAHPEVVAKLYRNIGRDLCRKLRDANEELREIRTFTGGPDPDLAELGARTAMAQRLFAGYTQAQIDRLVDRAADAVLERLEDLAAESADETGMGRYQDKIAAIRFAASVVRDLWRGEQTVGIVREQNGLLEALEPSGPICAVVSEANATAAIVFHALLALKTRNAVVFSFPNRAQRSAQDACRLLYETGLDEGAPEHWLGWITGRNDHRRTLELVRRPEVRVVVVNGRPALARSLAMSGKPVLADGAGCTPCYVHADADPSSAAADIVASRTFDSGTSCAAEQVVIVHEAVTAELVGELALRGASFVGDEARPALTALLFPAAPREDGEALVGRAATEVARLANLQLPSSTQLIAVRVSDAGPAELLAGPKPCPVVAYLTVEDEHEGLRLARKVLDHGGIGHTAVIHTRNEELIRRFSNEMPVLRVLVNLPAAQGAQGGLVSGLPPSLTMGSGTAAYNALADNLSPRHLLQTRRIVRRSEPAATEGERRARRSRRDE
jgi:acetaldehyde dehydrogenase/alcohol dehydrogenase